MSYMNTKLNRTKHNEHRNLIQKVRAVKYYNMWDQRAGSLSRNENNEEANASNTTILSWKGDINKVYYDANTRNARGKILLHDYLYGYDARLFGRAAKITKWRRQMKYEKYEKRSGFNPARKTDYNLL